MWKSFVQMVLILKCTREGGTEKGREGGTEKGREGGTERAGARKVKGASTKLNGR